MKFYMCDRLCFLPNLKLATVPRVVWVVEHTPGEKTGQKWLAFLAGWSFNNNWDLGDAAHHQFSIGSAIVKQTPHGWKGRVQAKGLCLHNYFSAQCQLNWEHRTKKTWIALLHVGDPIFAQINLLDEVKFILATIHMYQRIPSTTCGFLAGCYNAANSSITWGHMSPNFHMILRYLIRFPCIPHS